MTLNIFNPKNPVKRTFPSPLLSVTILLILFSVGAAVYSGYKYLQLRQDTNTLRLLPKRETTWGLSQLNIEELKFANALQLVVNQNNEGNRKNLSLRLDILYSRIDVTVEVFDRINKRIAENQIVQIYPIAAVFQQNAYQDLSEIRKLFSNIDRTVQIFLKSGDVISLASINRRLERMIILSSELASQLNQASSQTRYNFQENLFDQTNQFQVALLTIIFSFMLFSLVVLALYQNARRAERKSSQLAEDLHEANQAKTQFLSSMSHELRTPMNSILGFSKLLKSQPGEPLSAKQQESVDYILSSGRHLLDLINNVLNLSQIESGKLSIMLTVVNLEEVFKECLSIVDSQVKERGLSISNNLAETCYVEADYMRIKQVLLNLLSNAIKYNCEEGTVTLTAFHTSASVVRISVKDTGAGIPVDGREGLFEPFNRLGKEGSGIEGAGVGLSISRQMVEAMGGHIGCDSEAGKGSTFWVELSVIVDLVSHPGEQPGV